MGAVFDMKAFFRWLGEASERELADRHEILLAFIKNAKTESTKENAQYHLRRIEEEVLARMLK